MAKTPLAGLARRGFRAASTMGRYAAQPAHGTLEKMIAAYSLLDKSCVTPAPRVSGQSRFTGQELSLSLPSSTGEKAQQRSAQLKPKRTSTRVFTRKYVASLAAAHREDATHRSESPSIPVLSANEVHSRLAARCSAEETLYMAFYSSVIGGITRDPAAMVLPMDDHMVHRGHGVFDTAIVWEGNMYELDAHVDRILRSAARAKIEPPYPREELRRVILETAAVSGMRRGSMRYWLSAGPGGFSLSIKECPVSSFYVMAIAGKKLGLPTEGVKVITSSVPIKPPEFANTKSVNYLPNALVMWEAEQHGAAAGIWLDQEGFVAEGPSMNCAFVTQDDILLVPDFEPILEGCTMKRVMVLAKQLLQTSSSSSSGNGSSSAEASDPLPRLNGIQMGKVSVEAARAAKEMMLCGSGVFVEPVVQWDDQILGNGKPGPVSMALRKLLEEDISTCPPGQGVPISYQDT